MLNGGKRAPRPTAASADETVAPAARGGNEDLSGNADGAQYRVFWTKCVVRRTSLSPRPYSSAIRDPSIW